MTPRRDLTSSDRGLTAGGDSGGLSDADRARLIKAYTVILEFERDPETAERVRARLRELTNQNDDSGNSNDPDTSRSGSPEKR